MGREGWREIVGYEILQKYIYLFHLHIKAVCVYGMKLTY